MNSSRLFSQALEVFPGGVNSPVRNFKSVKLSHPLFIDRAKGSYIYDSEGNKYLDFVGSWGPMIHGHASDQIIESVSQVVKKGLSFGAPTALETKLAQLIRQAFPSMEKLRFTSSGTEATMTAVRLARGVTGKPYIIKFSGCYHGHNDTLLVDAGSGCATFSQLSSHGVLKSTSDYTLSLPYNDLSAVQMCFDKYQGRIAGVILEPIAGNMGLVPAKKDFLELLRVKTKKEKALLIFDEVMTGLRVARGGATEIYQVTPDLITLGKIVGGGLPLGVVGGLSTYMDQVAPSGPIYHAGTLSGNPCAVTAGITTLEMMDKDFHRRLGVKTKFFADEVLKSLGDKEKISVVHFPGMISFYRSRTLPENFEQVKSLSLDSFADFFKVLINSNIYWPPSLFEAAFLSQAHTQEQLSDAARVLARAFTETAVETQI